MAKRRKKICIFISTHDEIFRFLHSRKKKCNLIASAFFALTPPPRWGPFQFTSEIGAKQISRKKRWRKKFTSMKLLKMQFLTICIFFPSWSLRQPRSRSIHRSCIEKYKKWECFAFSSLHSNSRVKMLIFQVLPSLESFKSQARISLSLNNS